MSALSNLKLCHVINISGDVHIRFLRTANSTGGRPSAVLSDAVTQLLHNALLLLAPHDLQLQLKHNRGKQRKLEEELEAS